MFTSHTHTHTHTHTHAVLHAYTQCAHTLLYSWRDIYIKFLLFDAQILNYHNVYIHTSQIRFYFFFIFYFIILRDFTVPLALISTPTAGLYPGHLSTRLMSASAL